MPTIVLAMWKPSVIMISLLFCLSLFVAPLTNQIDSPLSSFSSSSSSSNNPTTATATSHPDKFKCSLNHIFKPNLYNKKTSTANENTNTLYYYKTTHEGEYPNKVYGLFLCVFGISLRSCRNCLRDAIVVIRQQCHGAKEAILWYDQCLVRYSYRPFFSTLETVPNRCTAASNADLYVANFTDILYQTFLEMIQKATFDAFNKYAIKASNISGSNIVLALHTFAQCIPNLSTEDCLVCMNIAVSIIPSCDFQGKKYGSILIPSCYIRYELYRFYPLIRGGAPSTPISPSAHDHDEDRRFIPAGAPTPTSSSAHDDVSQLIRVGAPSTPTSLSAHDYDEDGRLILAGATRTPSSPSAYDDDEVRRLIQVGATPTPTSPAHHDENHKIFRAGAGVPNSSTRDNVIGAPTSHNSKRRSNAWIIFLAIGIFIPLLLLITYLFFRRKRAFQAAGNNQELQVIEGLDDLEGYCQKFSLANVREATQNFSIKIGEGGFGPVFKGILVSGTEIAVKILESTSRSGQGIIQFNNEVISISRLQHRNIVRLLGYCFEENEKFLIYEFMFNRSLDVHLFDSTNGLTATLDWKSRINIIMGIVRALIYLHEDSCLKIIHRDIKTSNVLLDHDMNPKISDFGLARSLEDNQSGANTTTNVGTRGYMAPEYCIEGVISPKIDVYSFGVVLLEIISGRRNPAADLGLLGSTWTLWDRGTPLELMDEVVAQTCDDTKEVLRCIQIGLLCVQTNAELRPTMSSVRGMLENEMITLDQPTMPQFYGSLTNLPEASQQSALGLGSV